MLYIPLTLSYREGIYQLTVLAACTDFATDTEARVFSLTAKRVYSAQRSGADPCGSTLQWLRTHLGLNRRLLMAEALFQNESSPSPWHIWGLKYRDDAVFPKRFCFPLPNIIPHILHSFYVSLQPNSGLGHLIAGVSRLHKIRHTHTHTYIHITTHSR
jgi:hypothetical protein